VLQIQKKLLKKFTTPLSKHSAQNSDKFQKISPLQFPKVLQIQRQLSENFFRTFLTCVLQIWRNFWPSLFHNIVLRIRRNFRKFHHPGCLKCSRYRGNFLKISPAPLIYSAPNSEATFWKFNRPSYPQCSRYRGNFLTISPPLFPNIVLWIQRNFRKYHHPCFLKCSRYRGNFLKISPAPLLSLQTQFKRSDPLGYQKERLDFILYCFLFSTPTLFLSFFKVNFHKIVFFVSFTNCLPANILLSCLQIICIFSHSYKRSIFSS
jgi:hypothetical protein